MNSPIVFFNAKTIPDYLPSIIRHPHLISATEKINRYTFRIDQIVKEDPSTLADALALKVRNVLGHISLSVEIMNTITNENDLKTCLDVITRSTLRINNLIREFLSNQQLDAIQVQAKKEFMGADTAL